jgi:hypothetical protein
MRIILKKINPSPTFSIFILLISIFVSGFMATAQQTGNDVTKTKQQLPEKHEMIVAYYGRPDVAQLGVLGQYTIEKLIPVIKAKAAEYAKVSGNNNVVPAFDIIYGLAAADPGRDKDYILPLSNEKLMAYINIAQDSGFAVFIDLQLGGLTPVEAVKPVLKYLKYDNVHIAIDPEFEVDSLDVRPGKVVGHITGEEINEVQSAMSNYLNENAIKETKILVVHMFRESMVKDKKSVRNNDNIDLIMNLDGHGSPKLKIDIYNSLYTEAVSAKIAGGFKLFFNEDKPSMMTPKQVLGMEQVDGARINVTPKFINYE